MMTIKFILLLGLAAYATCGGGDINDDEVDIIDNYAEGNLQPSQTLSTSPTRYPPFRDYAGEVLRQMYGPSRTGSSGRSNLDGNHVDGTGSSQGTTAGNLQPSQTLSTSPTRYPPFRDYAGEVLRQMYGPSRTGSSGRSNLDGNHVDGTGSSQGTTADTKEEARSTETVNNAPFVFDITQYGIPANTRHYNIVGSNLGNTNSGNNNINWRPNNIGRRSTDSIDSTNSSQDQTIARYVIDRCNVGNTNCNNNNINTGGNYGNPNESNENLSNIDNENHHSNNIGNINSGNNNCNHP